MKQALRFGTIVALSLAFGLGAVSSAAASQRSSATARRAALDAEMGNDLAHSQRYDRYISKRFNSCLDRSQGVTAAMRDCVGLEEERLDRLPNDAYRQKMAMLSPPRRAVLQTSERTWLKRRKAYCDGYVTRDGGTAQLLDMDSCYLDTTIHRTLFVRRFK